MGFLDRFRSEAGKAEDAEGSQVEAQLVRKDTFKEMYKNSEKEGCQLENGVTAQKLKWEDRDERGEKLEVKQTRFTVGDDSERQFFVSRKDISNEHGHTTRSEFPITRQEKVVLPPEVARMLLSGREAAIMRLDENELVELLSKTEAKYAAAKQEDDAEIATAGGREKWALKKAAEKRATDLTLQKFRTTKSLAEDYLNDFPKYGPQRANNIVREFGKEIGTYANFEQGRSISTDDADQFYHLMKDNIAGGEQADGEVDKAEALKVAREKVLGKEDKEDNV